MTHPCAAAAPASAPRPALTALPACSPAMTRPPAAAIPALLCPARSVHRLAAFPGPAAAPRAGLAIPAAAPRPTPTACATDSLPTFDAARGVLLHLSRIQEPRP